MAIPPEIVSDKTVILADSGIPDIFEALSPYGRVLLRPAAHLVPGSLGDARLLVVRSVVPIGKDLLSGSRIRFVGSATAGTDHVDLAWLQNHSIAFAHAPGANADSVADYVIAALLRLFASEQMAPTGGVLGVVGAGQVGSRVARRTAALGLQVLLCDPPRGRREGGPFLGLDEVLERADIVSLHVPYSRSGPDATHHLMNADRLARFRGWLLNTARGPVVDGAALKRLRAAGRGPSRVVLDVWEKEPRPDPELVRLTDIATSHIAGYAAESKWEATRRMALEVARFLGAEPTPMDDPLGRVPIQPPAPDLGPGEWLWRLAEQMCPLGRDDQDLRQAVEDPAPDRAFEALRTGYRGRRLMRSHDLPEGSVPEQMLLAVRSGLGPGFSGDGT